MIPDDENDVVRYIMEEMDPSEEVLMERAMMEDDDLLIEVESMRHTLQRLDDLREKEPPAELSESIVRQARDHKKYSTNWVISSDIYKYAAVLIIGFGLGGGFWFFMNFHVEHEGNIAPAAVTITTRNIAGKPQVKPWVDRHNILYFQDKFSKNSGYQTIRQASFHKLTPVHRQSVGNSQFSSPSAVHLTSEEQP
jgi:hypothetical protein